MTTPEQLAKYRKEFEKSETNQYLEKTVLGMYAVTSMENRWQGYLRRCQETEQAMKLAKFGAQVLDEMVCFDAINIADVCIFAAQGNLLTDGGKVAPNIKATIKELLNE